MSSARSPKRPSSKTWNSPTGPAPTMTASVTVASLLRSTDKDALHADGVTSAGGNRGCESLLLQPLAIEEPRLIIRAAIAQHRHHRVTGTELACHVHGGRHVD